MDAKTSAQKINSRRKTMVPSPCQQICEIDPDTGWCKGCLRTLDEIAGWGQKPAAERDRIWNELHERKIQQTSGSGQRD